MAAEQWRFPTRAATWLALSHLVLLDSVAFFALYLFVLQRWTASGAAYSIVIMPLVAALLGAWLAGQPVTLSLAVAGAIVLAGVYFGALSRPRRPIPAPVEEEALAQRCATC